MLPKLAYFLRGNLDALGRMLIVHGAAMLGIIVGIKILWMFDVCLVVGFVFATALRYRTALFWSESNRHDTEFDFNYGRTFNLKTILW